VDEAGPDDEHVDAIGGELVPEALREGVDAGLRRAVRVVGLARALAGDRREQDDRAVALAAQALGEDRHDAHGADEVRARERDGGVGVGLRAVLVAEDAEGDDRDVDVAERGERGVGGGLVRRRLGVGIERDDVDVEAAGSQRWQRGYALGVANGEDDAAQAVLGERLDRRDRDLGVAAEDGGGLDASDRVPHAASSRRRARSERMTPRGSRALRAVRQRSSAGYIARRAAGRSRASLAR
jgi:hypothetical protein